MGKPSKQARKRRKREFAYLTESELEKLFAAIESPRDRALFRLAYDHGLRASEIGKLQMTDYHERERRIHVHRLKGSISGEYALSDTALRLLRAWLRVRGSQAGAIFLSRNSRPISRRRLDELMKSYCAAAGIAPEKAHMHALKHSCGTHLTSSGEELLRIADWIGHRNIQNTVIYTQVTSPARQEMGERLKKR